MRKLFLFLTIIMLSSSVFAGGIGGRILDETSKSPIQFVTVTVINKTTQKSVAGSLTNDMGFFNINAVPDGQYILKATFVGYKTIKKEITINTKKIDAGTLLLEEDKKMLKGVEVVGQGSQMRFDIDKKVFSVDQNIASSGGSATEALQSIPSVNVDNDGNISLRNNSNVEIWINGRPAGLNSDNEAQVLQQLPAGSIESIELMTNPSAKYSPEGTAGIINLVMKKDRKAGYYGSVGGGLMYANGNKLGTSANFSINYSSGKLSTYANVGYRNISMLSESTTDRTNFSSGDTIQSNQNESAVRNFRGLFLRGGLDYHLNDKNTVGFSGFGMDGNMDNNETVNYLFTQNSGMDTSKIYTMNNLSYGHHKSFNIDAYYKIDFDNMGSNLTTDLSYSSHNMNFNREYIKKDTQSAINESDIAQNSDNYNNEYELKIDYTKKFNETDKLEAGWDSNFQRRKSSSDGANNQTNTEINAYYNVFTDDEWIHAAYITYGKKINNFSAQLGLRVEDLIKNTSTTMKNIGGTDSISPYHQKPDIQLFPSVYLTYSLPNNNELQLNYTRRVNRPHGRQINSFRDYSDPTMVSFGNPLLNPEYASAFELNYLKNWDAHSFSSSLYYHYTENVIQQVAYLENTVMQKTYMNLTNQQDAGLEFVAKDRLFKILNLTSSLNLYYSKINPSTYTSANNQVVNIPGQNNFTWQAKILANFMLSHTLSGQISGQYIAPQVIGQGKQFEMHTVDLGLRKTFMDKKWTVSLTGRDIFNSKRIRTVTSGVGFIQTYESLMGGRMGGGRMLGLDLTYSFGNMKPKKQDMQKMQNSGADLSGGMDE